MALAEHTPGPWRVYRATAGHHVIGIGTAVSGGGITDGGFGVWGGGDAESLANATLIAAAPDLLETLVWVRKNYASGSTREINDRIDRAINAATLNPKEPTDVSTS